MISETNSLVQNLVKGDREAFTQLFRDFYKILCASSYRILKDVGNAEEVVQNVFVKIWEKHKELGHIDNIERYLLRSVYNESINFYRKTSIENNYKNHLIREAPLHYEPFDELLNSNDKYDRLQKAIENLPSKSKEIFLMSRYESLSYKEIAEKMGITPKGVEFHMVKAFKFLRSQLLDVKLLIICFLFLK